VQFAESIVATSQGTPVAAAAPPSPDEPPLEPVPDEPPEEEPAEDEPTVDEPPDDPPPGDDGPLPGTTITFSSAGVEQAPDKAGKAKTAAARRCGVLTDWQVT
jgi:hypothetical protein